MDGTHNPEGDEELYRVMCSCGHILYHSGSFKSGQGRILHILDMEGTISQKDMQERLNIQSGSISEILAKLEKEGLIERRRDERDRRKAIIYMTEAGREHALAYHERQAGKDWFCALGDAEKEELKRMLKILLDSWRPGHSKDRESDKCSPGK